MGLNVIAINKANYLLRISSNRFYKNKTGARKFLDIYMIIILWKNYKNYKNNNRILALISSMGVSSFVGIYS